jgi:methyl-accepting chemotaxis protein
MAATSEELSAQASELSTTSEELSAQADQLQRTISYFRIDTQVAVAQQQHRVAQPAPRAHAPVAAPRARPPVKPAAPAARPASRITKPTQNTKPKGVSKNGVHLEMTSAGGDAEDADFKAY